MSDLSLPDEASYAATDDESDPERLRRWRLILGKPANGMGASLNGKDAGVDRALSQLYDSAGRGESDSDGEKEDGGLGASNPNVARWLGDIRNYFSTSVVQVLQNDAIKRLGLRQMLLEPEILDTMEPDVDLVATLVSLNRIIPEQTRSTARQVVRKVVDDIEKRMRRRTEQAITGALNRSQRTNRRPRFSEIDWNRTIRANLKHYQPAYKTIIPESRYGYGRKQSRLRDVILCVDQSGSMATSVVYASVFGAVMASMRAISTRMIVFDTSVVDLTETLNDPVDLLFGVQLGGGTDINRALGYCQTVIRRPQQTICILISDLYEGGNKVEMLRRAQEMVSSGVKMIALLALSDDGKPSYDSQNAKAFAEMGIPAFACTPDVFPDLMAAALENRDLSGFGN